MSSNMQADSAKRTTWIEVARVFMTLLIINYHIPCSDFAKQSNMGALINTIFQGAGPTLMLFFALSGYFTYPLDNRKLIRRLLYLTISYLLYNTLCIVGLNDQLSFSRIYGLGAPSVSPADYPLWFVRDLIFLSLGLLAWRKARLITALLVVSYYIFNFWPLSMLDYVPLPKLSSIPPFVAGLMLSRISLQQISNNLKKFGYLSIIIHLGLIAYCLIQRDQSIMHNGFITVLIAISILAICNYFTVIFENIAKNVASYGKYSYLVYASHAPLLIIFGKAAVATSLHDNPFTLTILPVFIYILCVLGCRIMSRVAPSLVPYATMIK